MASANPSPPRRHLRWETMTRYYVAIVQRDLFGDWELLRAWGGKGSSRGGFMCEPAVDEGHAMALLEATTKRRLAHGYLAVAPSPSDHAGRHAKPSSSSTINVNH